MKIAYVFHRDASNPRVQSGRPASILAELQRLSVDVEPVFPLDVRPSRRWLVKKIVQRLRGRYYRWDREPRYLTSFAEEFEARTANKKFDLIFSPGSESISQLKTNIPITFCADATFANLVDYYQDFTKISHEYLLQGHQQEAAAMHRASLAVYPSAWAARSATEVYGMDPAKVAIIPFGANFGRDNVRENVMPWIAARPRNQWRILFVGRDWVRKGGEIVVETVLRLRQLGHQVELDIVGCDLPRKHRHHPWAREHGLLKPDNPAQAAELGELFARAHCVFVPSRAEAYGMTFAEGNAFGLPVVTTATGGITDIVRDGHNGLILPLSATAADYAGAMAAAFADRNVYEKMCRNAFDEFEQRLNWHVFGKKFLERASQLCTPEAKAVTSFAIPRPKRPLRVAFLANKVFDPRTPASWSGTPYYTKRALESAGVEVEVVWSNEQPGLECWARFFGWRFFRGKRYLRYCNENLLRRCGREIEQNLAKIEPVDAVFSLSTWLLVHLKTELPSVLYADASFGALLGFYQSFSDLAPRSLIEGHRVEQLALDRCTRAVYATNWAATTAQDHYRIDPAKIDLVYFGANFHEPPDPVKVAATIAQRDLSSCHLLLVGVDWYRKGADVAVNALRILRESGLRATLTIVGCKAPAGVVLPEGVEVIPFISKGSVEGRQQLNALYERSHFFILPSRAEASGIVFSEACAYGVPCLAPEVGGISSVVVNDVNGRIFSPTSNGAEYAEYIARMMNEPDRYRALAFRALRESETRLSWTVAGQKLAKVLEDAVFANQSASPRRRPVITGRVRDLPSGAPVAATNYSR